MADDFGAGPAPLESIRKVQSLRDGQKRPSRDGDGGSFGDLLKEHEPSPPERPPPSEPEVADDLDGHFATLTNAAEIAHQQLKTQDAPYRFCVYRQADQILIDIVMLDEKGVIEQTLRRNITHSTFDRMLRQITEGRGLIFNGAG